MLRSERYQGNIEETVLMLLLFPEQPLPSPSSSIVLGLVILISSSCSVFFHLPKKQ